MARAQTIREMRQSQSKLAEKRYADKLGQSSKTANKRKSKKSKKNRINITLITLNSTGIALVGIMALVLFFRAYVFGTGVALNPELQSLIVMLGFIIFFLLSMLVLVNRYMPKGWLAGQEKRIVKAVQVDNPEEEKWGGSLIPSVPRQEKVFNIPGEDEPAAQLIHESEMKMKDVAPFEAADNVPDLEEVGLEDAEIQIEQNGLAEAHAETQPEQSDQGLSDAKMDDLLAGLRSFILAVKEALEVNDIELDPFTKFGLNLYFAGACSRIVRLYKLNEQDARAVLSRLMQMTRASKQAADSFFDNVNEYGERLHYRKMIDVGDEAIARLTKAEEVDEETHLISDNLNDLLKSWCNPENDIEMPSIFTFMFTDIVEMTASIEGSGINSMQRSLRAHNRIVRTALERFSGREVKQTSNGIMATFDWTEKALEAANQIQQEIDLYSQANTDVALKIRIGIHEGEAIHEENDYYGTAVQTAARICMEAQPEEIWVSEEVLPTLPTRDDRFVSRGTVTLKGLKTPRPLYMMRWDRQIYIESREVEYTEIGNVKPPCYGPLARRVSGTGGLMLRA